MQYPSPIAGQAEEQGAFEGTEWPSSSSDGPGGDWMLDRSDDIEFSNHPTVRFGKPLFCPVNSWKLKASTALPGKLSLTR